MPQAVKSTKSTILTVLLTPFSWIYGAVAFVRNKLYDWGLLRSVQFDIPVVSVGNITVGGTGKTPHVEYMVENLSTFYNIAVLSRGYKRKTRGFVLASDNSTPDTIGDEPYQIYRKYGYKVKVAVCEDRAKGIAKLQELDKDINLILLDDAFQHRSVQPKVSVLLVDYSRPIETDHLLPLGRLRESHMSRYRADIVIVSKLPDTVNPFIYRDVKNKLDLFAYQKLYFSRIVYGRLTPVFEKENPYTVNLEQLSRSDVALLLSGIANPRPFIRHFKKYQCRVRVAHYPDHHNFTRADLQSIQTRFEELKGSRKMIITTEKDAVRLAHNPYFPEHLKPYIFYLPIRIEILDGLDGSDLAGGLREAINASASAPAPVRADSERENRK